MNKWHLAEVLILCLAIVGGVWAVVSRQIVADQPYVNPVGALILLDLEQNQTHTYSFNITNPGNTTIMVYTFLWTEPEQLRNYVDFSSSVGNGTEIEAYETVETVFSLTVEPNSFENTEYYIKVGSFRKGEDY